MSDVINDIKQFAYNVHLEFRSPDIINLCGIMPLEDNQTVNSKDLVSTDTEFLDILQLIPTLSDLQAAVLHELSNCSYLHLMDDQL